MGLMGLVIHSGGAARDPSFHNLFQIADLDTGVIRWVNADFGDAHPAEGARAIKSPALGGA